MTPAPAQSSILRLGDRVRIGASMRAGEILRFYDHPDGAGQTYALLRAEDGTTDARPVADLVLLAGRNGAAAREIGR